MLSSRWSGIATSAAACAALLLASACTSSSSDGAGRTSGGTRVAPSVNPGSASRPPSPTVRPPSGSATAGATAKPTDTQGRGTINQTVPSRTVVTAAPVALRATARFSRSVTARITDVRSVSGKARLPGETAGPAVALTLAVSNRTAASIDLRNVVVTLTDRAGVPAGSLSSAPARPFTGSVAPGRTASGVYVFTLAARDRTRVTVTVSYTADQPTLSFVGDVQ